MLTDKLHDFEKKKVIFNAGPDEALKSLQTKNNSSVHLC